MKSYLIFSLIFISSYLYSQDATIRYINIVRADTTKMATMSPELQQIMRKNLKGEEYFLYIKNGKSLYTSEQPKELILDNTVESDESGNIFKRKAINQPYSEIIYTDKSLNTRQSKITTQGNSYNIKEELGNEVWILEDVRKKIDDFECSLATTKLYGREIKAWYTTEIPLNFGPSRFHNLPGLIIQLEMGKRVITATKIDYSSPEDISPPVDGSTMSRNMFDALIMKQLNREVGVTLDQDGDTTTKKTVIKY